MRHKAIIKDRISAGAANSVTAAHQQLCKKLVNSLGGNCASTLGIDLTGAESGEIFKWFLASLILGGGIREDIAIGTYKELEKAGVLSPDTILKAGRQRLVDVLDRGGYVIYSSTTATTLLEVSFNLNKKYEGDFNRLHFCAKDGEDLETRIGDLGKGIAPTAISIFLREMRDLWEKSEPPLAETALIASRNLGLVKSSDASLAVEELRTASAWEAQEQERLSVLEAALMKLGENYCYRQRCSPCPVQTECQSRG
jgi:hypothetical protein